VLLEQTRFNKRLEFCGFQAEALKIPVDSASNCLDSYSCHYPLLRPTFPCNEHFCWLLFIRQSRG